MRRDTEVHQDAHDGIGAYEVDTGGQGFMQLAEGRVHDMDATPEFGEPIPGGGSGIGISIDAEEAKLRSGLEDRVRVTTAAQRGVDHHASRLTGEELDDLTFEHRYVKYVLGHLQPFNRQDG
jgi:hypothetical protein